MGDLRDLGLSSYEEKGYRALLARGPATARAISDASDVPRGRIYDVLDGLAARELVRVDDGAEPRRYEAVDPTVAVDRLLAARKRELDAERERYEQVAAEVTDELISRPPLESAFWTAGLGSDDARIYLRRALEVADERVLLTACGPYEAAPWEAYAGEVEELGAVAERDVTVKLLVTPGLLDDVPPEVRADLLGEGSGIAVRMTPDLHATLVIVDDREVSLDVGEPFAPDERLGGVVVRDERFVARLADAFERAWVDADPVDASVRGR